MMLCAAAGLLAKSALSKSPAQAGCDRASLRRLLDAVSLAAPVLAAALFRCPTIAIEVAGVYRDAGDFTGSLTRHITIRYVTTFYRAARAHGDVHGAHIMSFIMAISAAFRSAAVHVVTVNVATVPAE